MREKNRKTEIRYCFTLTFASIEGRSFANLNFTKVDPKPAVASEANLEAVSTAVQLFDDTGHAM
jgi:hypothetical protein